MTFLFVTWSGGGNVHPLVALGTRLIARGHRVRVLAEESLRGRFDGAGMAFEESTGGYDMRRLADDVEKAVARERPEVILVDYMQPAALCAAETAGVPVVAYVHTLYQRVAASPSVTPMAMSGDVDALNELRHDLGLPPLASLPALLDCCARVLVVTAVELDRPHEPAPANVRHVGPLVEDAGPDAGWRPPGSPLVHVSMGTVPPDEVTSPIVQRVLDAVADLDVHAFVTVPGQEHRPWSSSEPDVSALRPPANATVSGYVRHAAIMPHTDVFVTHAGLGGVGAALSFGVPMVCLPLMYEQPANAAHVATLGAGVHLPPDADVASLRAAIEDVLREPRYRTTARRVADRLRADGSGDAAVTELEALAG